MKIQLVTKPQTESQKDIFLALPVFEGEKLALNDSSVEEFLKDNPKFGKEYEAQLIYSDRKIVLVGAGKREKFDFCKAQNWSGTAARSLLTKHREMALVPPSVDNIPAEKIIEAVSVGVELAAHDPGREYKSEKEPLRLNSVQLLVDKATKEHKDGLTFGMILSEAINLVRRLGDMPSNDMTPNDFLNIAKKVAKENKLKIAILDEKMAKKKGLGAFVAVAKGSDEPSYLITLEFRGDIRSKEKWGLVGKGVTFDSGGISIKPASSMHEMKYDMCGAATVLGVMQAVAKLGLKVNVAGVCVVTENLPSGKALKPGDIIKTYSGKSAEVLNTDAEGRLLLADGVSFAQKDLKCTKIVDIATLTGAIIISLGNYITGVFGNNPRFTQDIISAGAQVGEKFWELPMDEEYDEMIKSDFADMANIGHGGSMPGAAGSITGAKFIQKAIENDVPWAHLDIAGTAWDLKPKPYKGVGATGVGVKTLVELISRS